MNGSATSSVSGNSDDFIGFVNPQSVARRAIAVFLVIFVVPLGALVLIGASLAAALVFESTEVLIFLGSICASVAMFLVSYLALRCYGFVRSHRISMLFSASATIVLLFLVAAFLLRPIIPVEQQFIRDVPDDVELWDLPTGSVIAVRKISASSDSERLPILFLHGGPGAYSVSLQSTVNALSPLAVDGHDIYFYDQAGGGLSERLPDISDYTVARHLEDLKAVYARIGAEKLILIGSSGGASLGSSYMALHPNHVAAAVFSGPAPLYHPAWAETGDGGLDEQLTPAKRAAFSNMVETPRLFAALVLADINPGAAVRFAGEYELGSLFDKVANEFYLPMAVCDPHGIDVVSSGYGFWSNRMTSKSLQSRVYDPRPALRTNNAPVLVMRGACEYKKPEVANEYVDVFPNAQMTAFDQAGHMLLWEQPDKYRLRIRLFLSEAGLSDAP